MKHSRKLLLIALVSALVMAFALPASAGMKKVKKVDNFVFFIDQSGSMAMKHKDLGKKKIDLAVDTATRMAGAIPSLDYTSSMFLFAPFASGVQPMTFSQGALKQGIAGIDTDYDIFGRQTPLGNGLMDLDPVLASLSGKTALIIFTDGNSNYGADPIAQARALYAKYGSNLCIHVVSYADNARGQMIIDEIRALSGCSVVSDVNSLMTPAGMDAYAKDVFYKEVQEAKPVPVAAPMEKEVITFSLHFGFDKYQITDEMIPVLEQARMILEENSNATYEIAGHTDWTGTEQYNQGLSERRANSVKQWLIDNGVSTSRLSAVGYGELSPKYDNNTKEGRRLNRRVEITTK